MGYTTSFEGEFIVFPPLKTEHADYIKAFSGTRRMRRNGKLAEALQDPVRVAAGLPIGAEGGYFTGGGEDFGQWRDASVVEYNGPPMGQPGLWCQWTTEGDGTSIVWDGGEKFYEYVEWIEYLIKHFLAPWGYVLNGEVTWRGEESSDRGKIVIVNNVVTRKIGRVFFQ